MFFEKNQPDNNKNQPQQEYENRNSIDAMHITYPLTMRCIRISFFNIEVFCNLSPYSHKTIFVSKILNSKDFK